jgi:DNA-binding Lrp family transcriptional regulator
MRKLIFDKIDLNILVTLARDCRTSYRSVGSLVGVTSKSVKLRVKRMVDSGIIERFVLVANPAGFGYRTVHVLVRTNNAITKDEVITRVKQFGNISYYVHHMGRTSMAALIIKKSLDNKTIQSLNESLKPATVSSIVVSKLSVSTSLSETDLRIIKCLMLSAARTEISDIAKELDISEKTTTRRLNRMKEGHILEFSLQCNPAAMIGFIQFAILICVEKLHYRNTCERLYREFKYNILYRPSIIDPDDRLIFVLFAENVFKIDFILSRVDSFKGVRSSDVYILTRFQFDNDWVIREIDEKLLSQRQLSQIKN